MHRIDRRQGVGVVARNWRTISRGSQPWQLRWRPICESTDLELSQWIRETPLLPNQPRAIFATRQTNGKGQFGRRWISPPGGVWISAAVPWPCLQDSGSVFGLAVAVAVAERLEMYGVPVRIKWPNDLIVGSRKLAGLLPRLIHRGSTIRFARVGFGLNVCNRVPMEGVALLELLRPGQCQLLKWIAEVLIAFDRAIILSRDTNLVCSLAESRLWTNELRDPQDGTLWKVEGIETFGGLKLSKGSYTKVWRRWD